MVLVCIRSSSLRSKVQVPGKMFPSSFRSYGPGRRKDSAIRTLVAETLVLAKTHGCVEKIESELEEELRRESKGQDSDALSKWRRRGDNALRSKYVLLTVALFCVTDCALVLGELILDLHKVKDTLETSEQTINDFKEKIRLRYSSHIKKDADIKDVFDMISRSCIIWQAAGHSHNDCVALSTNSSPSSSAARPAAGYLPATSSSTTARTAGSERKRRSTGGDVQEETKYVVVYEESKISDKRDLNETTVPGMSGRPSKEDPHHYSLEEEIAHALHLTSVTLMTILVFETLLKAFCAGVPFFKRKLETFDFFIIMISFVVDIVVMQILPRYKIQDFVFILAFLLPWRVIRVVNSLVVAVQDHEHFRLKMLYSRKKKIQNSLRETEVKLQLFRAQCCALKRLCLNEGVEESKIEQIVQLDEYVVNRTGKSKCKVKIDNASVILLDKSDFPRLSPRPSLANLLEKRRSSQVDNEKDPQRSDKFFKRNGHTLTVDDALYRDLNKDSKNKGRKSSFSSFSFSNGPFSSLFGSRQRDHRSLPENSMVRRAGSQNQICEALKRDLLAINSIDVGVKRAGSQNQLCSITITSDIISPGGRAPTTPAVQGGVEVHSDQAAAVSGGQSGYRVPGDGTPRGALGWDDSIQTIASRSPGSEGGPGSSLLPSPSTVDRSTQISDIVGNRFYDRDNVNSYTLHQSLSSPEVPGKQSGSNVNVIVQGQIKLEQPPCGPIPPAELEQQTVLSDSAQYRLADSPSTSETQEISHPLVHAETARTNGSADEARTDPYYHGDLVQVGSSLTQLEEAVVHPDSPHVHPTPDSGEGSSLQLLPCKTDATGTPAALTVHSSHLDDNICNAIHVTNNMHDSFSGPEVRAELSDLTIEGRSTLLPADKLEQTGMMEEQDCGTANDVSGTSSRGDI